MPRETLWVVLALGMPAVGAAADIQPRQAGDKAPAAVVARLNRLQVTVDAATGSILRLAQPGAGTFLDTAASEASAVDLAYPIPQFEPLRLASRYSEGAKISQSPGQLVIQWDRLGPSRKAYDLTARVSATETLKAAPDGRSVILRCRVESHSSVAVRLVLFPDLYGLVPLGSAAATEFRSGPVVNKPFVALAPPEADQFYAVNNTFAEYTSTGKDPAMAGRWLDFGGAKGGLSLFPKRSPWNSGPTVMLQYRERAQRLRLMYCHYVNLAKGQTWESDEYWLTPHEGDWTKGRGPFEAWLKETRKGK